MNRKFIAEQRPLVLKSLEGAHKPLMVEIHLGYAANAVTSLTFVGRRNLAGDLMFRVRVRWASAQF